MTPQLETRRLILRPVELADADQFQSIFPQREIVRYLTNQLPWPFPPDGALTQFRDVIHPEIERGDRWQWSLRLKSSPDRIIGSIDLARNNDDNRGYWIDLPWRRQGLVSEAVEVVTDYWFETLKFPLMRVYKAIPNIASRRISEKQGMRIVAHELREYISGRLPTEIWEITAEEWRARRDMRR